MKTIATLGYSSTSLTWIRGIVEDEYGIKPTDGLLPPQPKLIRLAQIVNDE